MPLVLKSCDDNGVVTLTLNDPDNLNAMGEEMALEFRAIVSELKEQADIRAVILTGAGRAFSAGGNLAMLEAKSKLSKEENYSRMMDFYHSFLGILDIQVPIIAAVNGHAIGAGLCVACACDIRVVAQEAKLGFTFTRLALHPGMGATFFLPRVVGESAAMELMATGRIIKGDEVRQLGVASSVVPSADVLGRAQEVATEILQCGPLSVSQLTMSLRPDREALERKLDIEAKNQAENYAGEEFLEGVRATIEKRKPAFAK